MATSALSLRHFAKVINPEESEMQRHARCGEADGKKELPLSDAIELSEHERQIIYEAKNEWLRHESSMERRRLALIDEIGALRTRLDQQGGAGSDDLRASLTRELELLDQQYGTLSAEYRHAEEEYEVTRTERHRIEQLVGRPLDTNYTEIYVPLLIGLAIAEVPVNRLAFELFFESMPLVSLLLSGAIGGIFIFFAHTIGTMARRLQCKEVTANRDETILSITLISLLALVLMYFLGLMREMWVDVNDAGSLNLEAYLSGLDKTQKSLMDHLLIGSKGFTLLLLNLSIFAMGVVTAFRRHDPHPGYEKAVHLSRKMEQRFLSLKKRFELKRNELQRLYNRRITDRDHALKQCEDAVKAAEHELHSLPDKLTGDRKALVLTLTRRFMAYQSANTRIRQTPAPAYFHNNLKQFIESLL